MSTSHRNNLKERAAQGLVTHDNTGGYFVVECQGCSAVYPSFQCVGGGQIADTGDYDDARCPHCGQEAPEECDNVGLAWNTQQERINALQSDLNTKDEQIEALTFSDNDRELSRRSWFDEAKRLEKEVEALRKALKFYADREHYHFESGNWDTVSGEPLNILWCGDEPDFIEDGTVARTALSASADTKCRDGGMCEDSSHKCTGCALGERDEPVELPARKFPEEFKSPKQKMAAMSWNACLDKVAKLGPLYTRPAEQPDTGTNSDKYKAELYDEVWQLAWDMGFGNVTDALMKLQSQLQGKKFR